MAGAVLGRRAQTEGSDLRVTTAGLVGAGPHPPHRAIVAMRKRGLDISAHRSTELVPEMIDGATLVLGAARVHAWEAVALRPSAVGRIFTFKEFVRLGGVLGPPAPGLTLEEWIHVVHLSRRQVGLGHPDDEIEDPYRRSRRVYARVANEIDGLVEQLAGLIFPTLTPRGAPITWSSP